MVLLVAVEIMLVSNMSNRIYVEFDTYNSKVTTSRGAAEIEGGSKKREPFALPTTTLWVAPLSDTGVAAGEPG